MKKQTEKRKAHTTGTGHEAYNGRFIRLCFS